MNKELARAIGEAARQARGRFSWTQEDAAEYANVSVEFYARIERGKSLPSIVTFARLVSVLGMDANYALGRTIPAHAYHNNEDPADIRRILRKLRRVPLRQRRLVNSLLIMLGARDEDEAS